MANEFYLKAIALLANKFFIDYDRSECFEYAFQCWAYINISEISVREDVWEEIIKRYLENGKS